MDCNFEASDANENDLMIKIAGHAKETHNMSEIPQDVMDKIQNAIKK